jgi:polysaccharide export outer membrane protein
MAALTCGVTTLAAAQSTAPLSAPVAQAAAGPAATTPSTPPEGTAPARGTVPGNPPVLPKGVTPPPDYVIGADDVLSVVFWRDEEMSSEVTVRPDGKISLVLINEIHAAGLTPEQLRVAVTEAAAHFVADPTVTIVVRQIKSRKVTITGQVSKPGSYPLLGPTTVVQLISEAGGVLEWADAKNIILLRTVDGKQASYRVNYRNLERGKSLQENVVLRPGDSIIVP